MLQRIAAPGILLSQTSAVDQPPASFCRHVSNRKLAHPESHANTGFRLAPESHAYVHGLQGVSMHGCAYPIRKLTPGNSHQGGPHPEPPRTRQRAPAGRGSPRTQRTPRARTSPASSPRRRAPRWRPRSSRTRSTPSAGSSTPPPGPGANSGASVPPARLSTTAATFGSHSLELGPMPLEGYAPLEPHMAL